MITTLTPKQEAKIKVYQQKWNDMFFKNEFDEKLSGDMIDWLYYLIKKDRPIKVFLDSPMAVQLAINILKFNKNSQLRSQLHSQLHSQLGSQLGSQLDSQLGSQLRSQLRSQLHSQLRSQLGSQLCSQLYSQLRSQLGSQLCSQLYSQIVKQKLNYYDIDWWVDTSWFGYLAFYDFINHELLSKVKIDIFETYLKFAKSKTYMLISFEGICFVSKPPTFTAFYDDNRLHCTTDYAVAFADGYGQHYLWGVYFSPEDFQKYVKGKKATATEILAIENAEQRASLIKLYGYDYLLDQLPDLTKLDESKEDKAELYSFTLSNNKFCILALQDHSTDKKYFLGVPNDMVSAKKALAWSFQLKYGFEYKPILQS
jgi:hypothetical protein